MKAYDINCCTIVIKLPSQVQEQKSKTLASHEGKSVPNYKRGYILVMILACCNTSSGNLKLKTAFVRNPENLMPPKI